MKTWSSSLHVEKDEDAEKFLSNKNTMEYEEKLIVWDILTVMAHQFMLEEKGIITKEELSLILKELLKIYENGIELKEELEDVHSNIEAKIIEKLGDVGKKMHTFKSRNDQVLTDMNLYMKNELFELGELAISLIKILAEKANEYKNIQMPGYTHYQQAMPYTFSSYIMNYFYLIVKDIELLLSIQKILDVNPLGAGAGFGFNEEINKEATTNLLGFGKYEQNSLAAINSRGKSESMALFVCSQIMLDLNKMSEDLILFSTKEFGFIDMPSEFCTGSSIMPQKNNPDVLEVIKGKSAFVMGKLNETFLIIKNLPSGYNKDTSLTKYCLMDSFEVTKKSVKILTKLIKGIKPNPEKIQKKISSELFATDNALELVKNGIPYKDAYKIIADKINKAKAEKNMTFAVSTCSSSALQQNNIDKGEKLNEFLKKDEFGNFEKVFKNLKDTLNNNKNKFENSIKNLIEKAKLTVG